MTVGELQAHPILGEDDCDLQEAIEILEKHCLSCQKEGKYTEAALAKSQRQILCDQEALRAHEKIGAERLAERAAIEEAHMNELRQANEFCDQKLAEFEKQATLLQSELLAKHQEERKAYLLKLQMAEPRMPRWSKELLRQRAVQESLGKLGRYSEAGRVKAQADELETKEYEEWGAKRQARMANLDAQYQQKQKLEMCGLQHRIQSGRNEQKKAKHNELDRLVQRHLNVMMQLDSQQRMFQKRIEKNLTSTPRPSSAGLRSTIGTPRPSTPGARSLREQSPAPVKLDGSFRAMTPRGRTTRCMMVRTSLGGSHKQLHHM